MKHKFLSFVCLSLLATALYSQSWELEVHTDEFGDEIQGGYFIWNIIEDASMSNTATSGSKSAVIFRFEGPEKIYVTTHDYGLSNPSNNYIFGDYVTYGFKDNDGNVLKVYSSIKNYNSGQVIEGIEALAIREMFLNNESVKCYITFDQHSKYIYTIDNSNFEEALRQLLLNNNYSEEEIESEFDIETHLYNEIIDLVTEEMNPVEKYVENTLNKDINTKELESLLKKEKQYFPLEYEAVINKIHEKNYQEWIDYFNILYGTDITKVKRKNDLEQLFTLLGIEITNINNSASKDISTVSNVPDPLDSISYTQADSLYLTLGTYGIGLRSIIGENKRNYFSGGFSYGVEWFGNANHGLHILMGFYNNDAKINKENRMDFDYILGYSYRKALSNRFELNLRLGLDMTCCFLFFAPLETNTYDKPKDEISILFGPRVSVGFNYFVKEGFHINFGVSDRLAFITDYNYIFYDDYKRDKLDNLLGIYVGLGWSFF